MKKDIAENLIQKTRDDYNLIADQFASTRKYNWGDLQKAFKVFPLSTGDKILDLGCGNGRMYDLMEDKDIEYFGFDISKELISHARKRVPNGYFKSGDLLNNGYKDNEFDAVICIATLHHIPQRENRRKALKEIYRITKPGGKIMISNWYFWNQPEYKKLILQNIFLKFMGKSDLDFGDFYMKWKDSKRKVLTSRYFHAWTKHETVKLLSKIGFVETKIIYHEGNNIGRNLITITTKPDK